MAQDKSKEEKIDKTVFEMIADRDIPGYFLYEDNDWMVILDAFPQVYAQTSIIPKHPYTSNLPNVPTDIVVKGMELAHKASVALKQGLGADRVGLIVEGLELNHFHIKLYPRMAEDKWLLNSLEKTNPAQKEHITEEYAEEILDKVKI